MSALHKSRSAVAGSSVEPDLTHRRMFGPAPGLRPFAESTVFDRVGGQATVDRLVDSLYDRFEADGVLRPLFGRDLSTRRKRRRLYFAECLGGPPRYSESAWSALYRQHEDLPITRAVAERWLGHLRGALSDTVPEKTTLPSSSNKPKPWPLRSSTMRARRHPLDGAGHVETPVGARRFLRRRCPHAEAGGGVCAARQGG